MWLAGPCCSDLTAADDRSPAPELPRQDHLPRGVHAEDQRHQVNREAVVNKERKAVKPNPDTCQHCQRHRVHELNRLAIAKVRFHTSLQGISMVQKNRIPEHLKASAGRRVSAQHERWRNTYILGQASAWYKESLIRTSSSSGRERVRSTTCAHMTLLVPSMVRKNRAISEHLSKGGVEERVRSTNGGAHIHLSQASAWYKEFSYPRSSRAGVSAAQHERWRTYILTGITHRYKELRHLLGAA
jgi:hypothetical protein